MNQVLTVAKFTFREAVRKKAFWVTNFIYIAIIIAATFVLPLLGDLGGMDMDADFDALAHVGTYRGAVCYLLDESGDPMLAGLQDALAATGMQVIEATGDRAYIYERIQEDANAALLHIVTHEGVTQAIITTRDLMSRFPMGAVGDIINYTYRLNHFAQAGYDMHTTQGILQAHVAIGTSQLQDIMNMMTAFALVFFMFMAIYTYGVQVAMSVATEKSTRVMETLIVSTKPARILVGKCVGMGLVGLSQLLGILALIAVGAHLTGAARLTGGGLSLPELGPEIIALLVMYFLLGYALFSMINSMCGALVSKMEDINSAMMPAMLIAIVSLYAGGYVPIFGGATAGISRIVLLVPFTAPFAAPGMLLGGEVDFALVAASAAILLATIVLVGWISGKVYSVSVLHYGSRLKFSELRRMLKGNK